MESEQDQQFDHRREALEAIKPQSSILDVFRFDEYRLDTIFIFALEV